MGVIGERLGLVGVSTQGAWEETWFSGGEYRGCLEIDLV